MGKNNKCHVKEVRMWKWCWMLFRNQRCQTEDCPQTCRQKTVGEAQTESGTEESGGQTRGTDIQVRGYGQSVWHLIRQTWASYLSNIPQLFPPLSSLSAARKLDRGKEVWYVNIWECLKKVAEYQTSVCQESKNPGRLSFSRGKDVLRESQESETQEEADTCQVECLEPWRVM